MFNKLVFESKFEVKGDGSTFTGFASRPNILDQVGDVVQRGAFSNDLRARGDVRPMLWNHEPGSPIGKLTLEERADGLRIVEGKISMDVQRGREAAALLKMGDVLGGTSIGYTLEGPDAYSYDRSSGARLLHRIKLMEVSLVTFPALLQATIDTVKTDEEALRELLRNVRAATVVARNRQEREALPAIAAAVDAASNEKASRELRELLVGLRSLKLSVNPRSRW